MRRVPGSGRPRGGRACPHGGGGHSKGKGRHASRFLLREQTSREGMQAMSRNLQAEITAKILEYLDRGVVPWRKPWNDYGTGAMPRNAISNRA